MWVFGREWKCVSSEWGWEWERGWWSVEDWGQKMGTEKVVC